MNFNRTILIVSLGIATGAVTAQTGTTPKQGSGASSPQSAAPAGAGPGMPLTAAQQQSMAKLQEAASRLRDSIAAMKGKSDAAGRDRAIGQAQEALSATQRAMAALPAEIRNAPDAAVTAAQYDESVEKMMRAADALRESVQAMAKLPAGEARNRAMQQANQALLETNAAMVMAYAPSARADGTGASGTAQGAAVRQLREESREVSKAAQDAAVRARNDGTPGMTRPDAAQAPRAGTKALGGPAAQRGTAEGERR